MRISEKICIGGIFICGLIIGTITITMPGRSPEPLGLVYAAVYICSPIVGWALYGRTPQRE